MSTPCPALICEPWNPLTAYSTQGGQVPVVPPIKYGNNEVRWCCPAEEVMAFTGTLPVWVTLDPYTNCLVGAANTILANSPAVATAQAQASLNAWAIAHLADYSLTCTGPTPPPPVGPCNDRQWFTETLNGTMTSGVAVRFPIITQAGVKLSFFFQSNDFSPILNVIAPDAVTVLATNVSGDAYSQWPAILHNEEVDYTFPDAQTYWIEVQPFAGTPTGNFDLIVAQNLYPTPLVLTDGQWRFIYVPSTHRIFCLSAFGNSNGQPQPDSDVTVIDSVTGLVVNTVVITAAGGGVLTDVVELIFYNPNDDSVWVCRQHADTTGEFVRLDSTTGAIIESWATVTSCITQGVFVPEANKIFGTLNGTDANLAVYNCNTRLFEAAIVMADGAVNWTGWLYMTAANSPTGNASAMFIVNTGTPYLLFVDSTDGTMTQVALAEDTRVWDFRPLWIESKGLLFAVCTTGGNSYLSSINIVTGAITHLVTIDSYRLDSLTWDECLDCLVILLPNDNFPDAMEFCNRYDFAGTLLDSQTVFVSSSNWPDDQYHPGVLYDPDKHRCAVLTNRALGFI